MRTTLRAWLLAGVFVGGALPAAAQHQEPRHEPSGGKPAPAGTVDHSQHAPAARELPPFIPPITDADRLAAFPPDVEAHAVHDRMVHAFVLFDQLEWRSDEGGTGVTVDTRGWVGRDRDRLWFRAEGEREGGRAGETDVHVLYGRHVSRWWDLVGGIRQDLAPGPARTWAAVGIQGLAPYWFEIELTGYVGVSGRTSLRGEVEYDLLLTNRLVLQPLVEVNLFGKADPERGVGAGLATTDAGVRLRYEIRREIAPYAGVTWGHRWGETADLARAAGEETGGARFVAGLRLWF